MTKVSGRFLVIIAGIGAVGVISLAVLSLNEGAKISPSAINGNGMAMPSDAPIAPVKVPVMTASASIAAQTPGTQQAPVAQAVPAIQAAPSVGGVRLNDAAVKPEFHPQIASVVEAQKTGKYPERLSEAIDPAPFDPAAFAANPQAYVNIVEPGRVYQTAAAGPTAVPLIASVEQRIVVPPLGQTPLSVRGVPHAPVSFTTLGGGMFENHLAATTVLADEHGVATVRYIATPNTFGDIAVKAGSPMAVGTLTLRVHVPYPSDSAAVAR